MYALYSDVFRCRMHTNSAPQPYSRKGFRKCIQCIQRIPTPFVFRLSLLLGREYMNTANAFGRSRTSRGSAEGGVRTPRSALPARVRIPCRGKSRHPSCAVGTKHASETRITRPSSVFHHEQVSFMLPALKRALRACFRVPSVRRPNARRPAPVPRPGRPGVFGRMASGFDFFRCRPAAATPKGVAAAGRHRKKQPPRKSHDADAAYGPRPASAGVTHAAA